MAKLTKWEQAFWDAWQADGLPGNDLVAHHRVQLLVLGELKVLEFDFASVSQRLLIEIDGLGGWDARIKAERCGAHQSAKGMRQDALKRNSATEAGWTVLHYPSSALDSGPRLAAAIEQVNRVMSNAR